MTKLIWDDIGKRLFETGIDKAVLYLMDSNGVYPLGVPWNGLTSITETPSGAEPNPLYGDNIKYLTLMAAEGFAATLEAYTYPEEFGLCDGTDTLHLGGMVSQQPRKKFGLVYRTKLGNDVGGQDLGYKLHLIYGCLASPSEKAYASINESPEAITFSWEIATTPINVTGFQSTSLIIVISTQTTVAGLSLLEDQLFGDGASGVANLPLPDEIRNLLDLGKFAFRDHFIYNLAPGSLNGTLATPGYGKRAVTDVESVIKSLSGRLRGGGQPSSPVWGESKILFTKNDGAGFARVTGRTLMAVIIPEDMITTCDVAFGWDVALNTTDPRIVGHGWLLDQIGLLKCINPGVTTVIEGNQRNTPPIQYLVIIALNDVGAYTLISSLGTVMGIGSTDPLGIPQYPLARILWSDYSGVTALLYPYISYYQSLGYPNGNSVEDVRILDVEAWAVADFLATMADRFTRGDSTTLPGTGWNSTRGTWGISSNQLYVSADEAAGYLDYCWRNGGNADGMFTFRVVTPAAGASMFYCILRGAAGTQFIALTGDLGGSTIRFDIWNGGNNPASSFGSASMTWVNNTVYDIVVVAKGNKYSAWVNGVAKILWAADAGNNYLAATGVGYGVRGRNVIATWGNHRFDNIATHPNTITIPTVLAVGKIPDVLTGASTVGNDTFTDTNGVRLNAHTAEAGGTWTEHSGTWTIQSNHASCSAAVGSNFATQNLGVTDAEITLDCIAPGTFSTDTLCSGLTLRYVDANNYLAVRLTMSSVQPGQDEIEFHELIGGTGGVVKKVNLANYYVPGATYVLKVQCKSDLVQVFLDGRPLMSYITQVGSPLGTRFGLIRQNIDDGVVFDNLVAKVI